MTLFTSGSYVCLAGGIRGAERAARVDVMARIGVDGPGGPLVMLLMLMAVAASE